MDASHLDPKVKRWMYYAERSLILLVLVLFGMIIGYLIGVQGSDARVAAADARLLAERTDRLEEIKRLQDSNSIALGALSRLSERTARKAEKAADKAETAASTAETAATTAKGAANQAKRVAPPAAGVNEAVRDANRRLGSTK